MALSAKAQPVARATAREIPRAYAVAPRPLLTVVVPTYNERDNIDELVARVDAALEGVDFEIIFVDDSNDDTPQVILGLRTEFVVKLIHRESWERDGGLSTAILRGLSAARGEYISVIDGDLQHPPEKLAEMLSAAQDQSADIVVASRYRSGGSADGLASAFRRIVSQGSRWMSKAIFYDRLRAASDPGSGFFLVHRDVIDGVHLRPIGYKMLMEILVRGRWTRLAEVPYAFQARSAGDSKADFRQGMQYLRHTARIFIEVPDVARLWKFLAVGLSGVAVNLGTLWLATEMLASHAYVGWFAAVEMSVLSNFWWNRTFTWRDRRAHGIAGIAREGARYHASSVIGVACNFVAFTVATTVLQAPTLVAGLVGIMAGFAANFAGATRFVFPMSALEDAQAVRPRLTIVGRDEPPRDISASRKAA